jgi:hypothetical protein
MLMLATTDAAPLVVLHLRFSGLQADLTAGKEAVTGLAESGRGHPDFRDVDSRSAPRSSSRMTAILRSIDVCQGSKTRSRSKQPAPPDFDLVASPANVFHSERCAKWHLQFCLAQFSGFGSRGPSFCFYTSLRFSAIRLTRSSLGQ